MWISVTKSAGAGSLRGRLAGGDATQGIEAQTLANLYLALDADLEVIPVVNKIDLPSARPAEVRQDISNLLGTPTEEVICISAKDGTNVEAVLEAVVQQVPPPKATRRRRCKR